MKAHFHTGLLEQNVFGLFQTLHFCPGRQHIVVIDPSLAAAPSTHFRALIRVVAFNLFL
jgi:hypothetical protein